MLSLEGLCRLDSLCTLVMMKEQLGGGQSAGIADPSILSNPGFQDLTSRCCCLLVYQEHTVLGSCSCRDGVP